jgi:hypothetical protein
LERTEKKKNYESTEQDKKTIMIDFPEKNHLERLEYLYAEIHDDEIIPEDKIEFWKRSLKLFSLQTKKMTFSVEEIQSEFTSHGLIPISFQKIISKLEETNQVIAVETLEKKVSQTNDQSLLTALMSSLWSYSATLIKSAEEQQKEMLQKKYVNLIFFQELEKCLKTFLSSKRENEFLNGFLCLHSLGSFSLTFPNLISQALFYSFPDQTDSPASSLQWKELLSVHSKDYDYFISYLLQKKSISGVDDKIISIKGLLPSSSSSSSSALKVDSLSEEVALAKLKLQISLFQVNEQIEVFNTKIQVYHSQAVKAKVCPILFSLTI